MIVSIMQTELFIPSPQPIKITFELVFFSTPIYDNETSKTVDADYIQIEHFPAKVHIASDLFSKLKKNSFLRFVIRDCIKK